MKRDEAVKLIVETLNVKDATKIEILAKRLLTTLESAGFLPPKTTKEKKVIVFYHDEHPPVMKMTTETVNEWDD